MVRISKKEEQEFEREHEAAIRKVAAECTMFLKRDGIFPVLSQGKLALYRNGARHTIKGGTGSGDVNVRHFATVEEGLIKAGFQITTNEWLADILTGKSCPSWKLTMTWADMKDYPSTKGFGDINDTEYKEDIFIGYRHFESEQKKPFFTFGFGLSYTDFAVEPDSCVLRKDTIILKAEVENTGSYKGKEVVQVYVRYPEGTESRPVKELKGFSKTKELAP
ncbi:MAG: fibronectin type III-like domain-contianing protein [Lachnospiraceae bacterium]|nr:fibronectin type III-like domain-contianing protein [Lachnospiraceae bacterium]